MHVTGGQYKGHKIIIPNCAKPTLSKVRQGVFNTLYSIYGNFEGMIFLDLFAGSGLMGTEALSRGFESIFTDSSKEAISLIKQNVKNLEGKKQIKLIKAESFIEETLIHPDVIYLDPPWDYDYKKIIEIIYEKFKNSILIAEYDKKRMQEFSEIYRTITAPFKEKVYGRCKLDYFKI